MRKPASSVAEAEETKLAIAIRWASPWIPLPKEWLPEEGERKKCPLCGECEHSAFHLLLHCPRTEGARKTRNQEVQALMGVPIQVVEEKSLSEDEERICIGLSGTLLEPTASRLKGEGMPIASWRTVQQAMAKNNWRILNEAREEIKKKYARENNPHIT